MHLADLPGLMLVLLVLVVLTLAALLRYLLRRRSGKEQVYQHEIVVTETGIEYLVPYLGTREKRFDELESVELGSYFKIARSVMLFRYGLNANKLPPNFFGNILVIGLKQPNPCKYLFFCAPKNATEIYAKLKSQIRHERPVW